MLHVSLAILLWYMYHHWGQWEDISLNLWLILSLNVNKLVLNTRSRIAATVFVRCWLARAFHWKRYGSHIGENMSYYVTQDKGNHLRHSMIENGTSVLLSRSTSSSSKFKVVIVSSKTKKRFWRTVKPVLFCCFAIIGLIIGRRSEGNEVDDWSPRFSEHIEWKKSKILKNKGLWNQIHCFLGVISCVNFY